MERGPRPDRGVHGFGRRPEACRTSSYHGRREAAGQSPRFLSCLITAPPGSAERVEVAVVAGVFSSSGVPPWFSGRQAETGGIWPPAPSEDPPETNTMRQDARSSDSDIHTGIIARKTGFAGHLLREQRCRTRRMDKLFCCKTNYLKFVILAVCSPAADGGRDLSVMRFPSVRRGERPDLF